MPKLAAKDRKKVEKAEAVSGGFEPLAPGKYIAELAEVEAKTSGAGNAYWNAEFHEIQTLDGEAVPGRQWYMLMLPIDKMPEDYKPKKSKKSPEEAWATYQELTAGKIKAFFEAFGFTPDSDTDELIGERCVLQIGVETINQGPKTGELTNRVHAVHPLDSVEFEEADEDEDNF